MAAIKTSFGSGGSGLTPNKSSGTVHLAGALRDIADDLASLRTKFINTLTKLDADSGVGDTNYVATQTPAALLTTKA